MLGKIIGWIIIILTVVWVLTNPHHAADVVHGWLSGIASWLWERWHL
jgi:hypothetical protein